MSKQVLILPDTAKFTPKQRKELAEAGIVVVYLQDPSQARLMSAEPPPFDGNDYYVAALKAIRLADSIYAYRKFFDELLTARKEPSHG